MVTMADVDMAMLDVVRQAARGGLKRHTHITRTETDADGKITETTEEHVESVPPSEEAARWLLNNAEFVAMIERKDSEN